MSHDQCVCIIYYCGVLLKGIGRYVIETMFYFVVYCTQGFI